MIIKPFLRLALAGSCLSFAAATHAQSLTSVHPAKETVLLKEDFNGPPAITVPDRNYGDTAFATVRDGHYILDAKNSARFWALRLETPALSAHPTILEMKMKVSTAQPGGAAYGILWHTTNPSPRIFNEYVFTVSSAGGFIIYAKINDQPHPVVNWTPCACVAKGNDAYNTLRIEEGEAGKFRFFINGQAVYEGDLKIPTITTFGFYSDARSVMSVDYIKFAATAP